MTENVENPILYPPYKELLKAAKQWEYNSEHPHSEIEEILGILKGKSNYYASISEVDRDLILTGKKLENIPGWGYRVVNPDEHVRMSNNKVKKAIRYVGSGLMISQHARRDKMDNNAKKRTDEHTMSLSRTYSMLSTETKPLFEIEAKMAVRQLRAEKPKMFITEGEGGNNDKNN